MGNNSDKNGVQHAEGGRDMDRQISGLLQAMYGSVESEPIPERFLDLLEKLDAAEKAQKSNQSS
jgi:Anti-sigma factor NepR